MKKQIFLATITYTLLTVLQPLANFILLPVYTTYFTEAQYGVFSILNNINVFFSILGGLSIIHAIIAFYTTFSSPEELNRYVGNVLSFTMCFNAGLLLITSFCGQLIFNFVFKEHIAFFPDGFLTVSYGLITNVITGYLFFLKYQRKLSRYAVISIIMFMFSTALQYVFIVFLKGGISGALFARVLASFLCLLVVIVFYRTYLIAQWDFAVNLKPSLKYSIHTIPSSLITWLVSYGDRFLIERFIDLKNLGIYSFLATICSLTEMVFLALGSALQPFIFDYYKTGDNKKINDLYKLFIVLTIATASFIVMLGSNLDSLVKNKGFLEIVQYLPIMILGQIFAGLAFLFNLQTIYMQKSKYFIPIGVMVLITNVVFNILLLPILGIWGAVFSSVCTKMVMALLNYYYGNLSFKISLNISSFIHSLILISLLVFAWLIAHMHLLPFNISSILQFAACASIILFMYRKFIFKTYQHVTQLIFK